jgi:sirohydrochlorin cobaltochelatase
MSSIHSPSGLILFAHGARDPRWAEPFQAVAQRAAALSPGLQVQLAFLEFMEPGLSAAGDMLAARGCGRIDIVPLFLGAGGHVRRDLPALVEALRARHPQLQWRLHPAAGEAPGVIDALARAAVESAR